MIGDNKEARHDIYCPTCKNRDESEWDDTKPCWECLETPYNQDSNKPINWEPRD
jgi:hypothetical protein